MKVMLSFGFLLFSFGTNLNYHIVCTAAYAISCLFYFLKNDAIENYC